MLRKQQELADEFSVLEQRKRLDCTYTVDAKGRKKTQE